MTKSFRPTEKQIEAFNEVSNAIKKAKKLGLVFYAKSDSLVAYTKQADKYIEIDNGFENCLSGKGNQIINLSSLGLITDSGADDYAKYITIEDEEKYS